MWNFFEKQPNLDLSMIDSSVEASIEDLSGNLTDETHKIIKKIPYLHRASVFKLFPFFDRVEVLIVHRLMLKHFIIRRIKDGISQRTEVALAVDFAPKKLWISLSLLNLYQDEEIDVSETIKKSVKQIIVFPDAFKNIFPAFERFKIFCKKFENLKSIILKPIPYDNKSISAVLMNWEEIRFPQLVWDTNCKEPYSKEFVKANSFIYFKESKSRWFKIRCQLLVAKNQINRAMSTDADLNITCPTYDYLELTGINSIEEVSTPDLLAKPFRFLIPNDSFISAKMPSSSIFKYKNCESIEITHFTQRGEDPFNVEKLIDLHCFYDKMTIILNIKKQAIQDINEEDRNMMQVFSFSEINWLLEVNEYPGVRSLILQLVQDNNLFAVRFLHPNHKKTFYNPKYRLQEISDFMA
jgi:hypothetical protein